MANVDYEKSFIQIGKYTHTGGLPSNKTKKQCVPNFKKKRKKNESNQLEGEEIRKLNDDHTLNGCLYFCSRIKKE